MDAEKRKRDQDRNDDERKVKKKNDVIEEEEVEEFFAILRRMRTAVKYFQSHQVDRRGREMTATTNNWKPSFQVEDFQDVDGVKERSGSTEREYPVEDASSLDLNIDPTLDAEHKSVLSFDFSKL